MAPERVVPFLRPYPTRAHRTNWFDDPDIPGYVLGQLDRIPYQGIGEFHVFGEDADSHIARQVIGIARERSLALHAHTDTDGMMRILAQAPDTTVIWAHAGFDVPVETLQRMLRDHPNLFLELSFREDITRDGELTEDWRTFFTGYPRRFLVGTDTYTPGRWADLEELARASKDWLRQLPDDVAQRTANGNAQSLFGPRNDGR
ncbi:MAG: amidohydrolase family protein [Pseudomonadota bacterium]|nr:amidohydrolase family protein [Pseudomonadota bacterium]